MTDRGYYGLTFDADGDGTLDEYEAFEDSLAFEESMREEYEEEDDDDVWDDDEDD